MSKFEWWQRNLGTKITQLTGLSSMTKATAAKVELELKCSHASPFRKPFCFMYICRTGWNEDKLNWCFCFFDDHLIHFSKKKNV